MTLAGRSNRSKRGVLTLALGLLASVAALLVVSSLAAPPVHAAPLAAQTGALAARASAARPTLAVARDEPAVVRVLSYYYGTTKDGNLVPVPVACAGTGVLVGTTGVNQFNYVLTASAVVNPITPCEGAQAAFQQVNQAAQGWGLIRVEVWLGAAYTGAASKQLGTIKYQISPSVITTTGGPGAPSLIALPLASLSGAPNHDLPVLLPPQPSDTPPATPNRTVLDLGGTGDQLLGRDSLADSEVTSSLYSATVDASLLGQEILPTPTKPPTATPPQQTVVGGTPLPTQAPPTSTATAAGTATPSTYAMAVGTGAPVVDDNGALVGMVVLDSTGNHIVAPLSQVTLAIGPVSGKPGPVMTQWAQGIAAFYATPPDYAHSTPAFSGLATTAPDFGGVAPFLTASKNKTTNVALPWSATTPTATPGGSGGGGGGGVSLPLVLGAVGLVLFALLLLGVALVLRMLRRRRDGGYPPEPPGRGRQPTKPRELDAPLARGARGRTTIPIDEAPTQKQPAAPGGVSGPMRDASSQSGQGGQMAAWSAAGNAAAAASRGLPLTAQAAGRTDPGRKRAAEPNQDNVLALTGTRVVDGRGQPFGLFIVADGMGGHMNGKEASRRTIEVVSRHILPALSSGERLDPTTFGLLLQEGAMRANADLREQNQQRGGDMGTTMTAALVVGDVAYVANVGDSRTYVFSPESGLRRVTTDHSVVASLVAAGVIQPDDMYTHPRRNQIYRSLGGQHEDTAVDIFDVLLQPGDKLLLCSDGLWEMVRDPQIEQVLRAVADPAQAVDLLVQEANKNGGEDNISVIVVRMLDERAAPATPATPGLHVIVAPQDTPPPGQI